MKDDVIVLLVLAARMVEDTGHIVLDAERTGHAEMRHDDRTIIQFDQEIFGAPPERGDGFPLDTGLKPGGEGKSEVRAVQLQPLDDGSLHAGGKAPAHGFHLWQFRHRLHLPVSTVRRLGYRTGLKRSQPTAWRRFFACYMVRPGSS